MADPVVRPVSDDDRPLVWERILQAWGLPVVTPARTYESPERLDGLGAEVDGSLAGFVLWHDDDGEREVVVLDVARKREGLGTRLMGECRSLATAAGLDRVWLITTDENTTAIAFYTAMGMDRVRTLPGFIEVTRAAKPELPADAFTDAIEFSWRLRPGA